MSTFDTDGSSRRRSEMVVTITIDPERIAEIVNEAVGETIETPESVELWINQNGPSLGALLAQGICETLGEI